MAKSTRLATTPAAAAILLTVYCAAADDARAPALPSATAATAASAVAATPSGLEVATRMDSARRAKSEHQVMTMTLENASSQQRVRTIEGWSREINDAEDHRFVRFLEPPDVKDTTLLTYDYDEADDDIWLYLPALKKVKRILSSNKTDYFMGSDFTYWDMENVDLVNWDYRVTGNEVVDGADCYVLEANPTNDKEIEESGYHKFVTWVGKSDWVARRAEYTDVKDRVSKRLTATEIHPTSPADPRPRAHRMLMENLLTHHKTTLAMSALELDVAVDDNLFSQRNMMP